MSEDLDLDQLEDSLDSTLGAKELRFLVVDDSVTMRRIVSKCLRDIGADDVVEAADGMEALGKLHSAGPFDVILTDWNMPVMNGLNFLKQVQAKEEYKDIPVIMVTTEAEKSNVIEAIKAGAKNYVVKPFTAQTLKEKIEGILDV
jgi:two-component system, chemotaxis family, chemotaxis protein CheY